MNGLIDLADERPDETRKDSPRNEDRFSKRAIFFLMRMTLVPFFTREVIQRKKVTIIYYHDPDLGTMNSHIEALRKKYNIISLKEFIDAVRSNNGSTLPKKSLIITYDDGHVGNFALLPIFSRYEVKPTIFLCTGLAGTKRHFWFIESRGRLDVGELNAVPCDERIERLKGIGFAEDKEYESRQALSKDEIGKMKGIVDFQSHTVFHASLPRCSDERANREILDSKRDLTQKFGLDPFALSYPNGDYSPKIVDMARKAGYACGITADPGFNDIRTDLFRLKRICMRDSGGGSEAIVRASGFYDRIRRVLKPQSYSHFEVDPPK
jgi:peptidoglycan/xylan/chitin deacetylase (PgdA/CDA1 family)